MAKTLTIEIGMSTTKMVLMDYQAKKPKVYKCVEIPTPDNTIADGYIVSENIDLLRTTLKKALKTNRMHAKRVIFTVFSSKIITREIMLPAVKEHQINAVIESNITEYFPIELNDYKIAHIKIETFKKGENAGKHKVLVIAAEKILLEGYEKLASLLKLNLADIDYSGNSTFQAFKNSAGSSPIMVVKAETDIANIIILKEGKFLMQRTVNYNSGQLLEGDLRTLSSTVARIIDFYASKYENENIEKIYITGDGSVKQYLTEMIYSDTQIDTASLDVIRGIIPKRKVKKVDLGVFACAIGCGMSSVGLDNEMEKKRHETNYAAASILMIILIILLAISLVIMAVGPYNTALSEQKALEQKRQGLESAKVVYDRYNAMLDLTSRVEYGTQLTENSNDAILDFLAELEKKLPSDVEMTEFYSDDTNVIMTMKVADKETAAGVIKNIREFETLESVVVESIVEETVDTDTNTETEINTESETYISFTITGQYLVNEYTDPAINSTANSESGDSYED
jgi:Tfp pilus assembly PilM family ATPase